MCGCPFVFGAAGGCVYASSLPTLRRAWSPSLISHNCDAVDRSACVCSCSRSKRSSLFLDKELYSATLNNFLGTEPVILRNLGQQHYSMKSEYLPAWLNGKPDNTHVHKIDMWPWSTKPVISSNSQQYIVWVKIIHYSFMPKIIRILSKDHVPWRYLANFLP